MAKGVKFIDADIVFWSGSITNSATEYSSSNPLIGTGSFTSSHISFMTLSLATSGSSSFGGAWTGSWIALTESGANSHGIPAGSASIFSGSSGWSIATQSTILASDDNHNFSIYSTTSSGAPIDKVFFYASSSGKIGIGTDSPTTDFEVKGELKTLKDIAGDTAGTGSIVQLSYKNGSTSKAQVGANMGGIKWNDDNAAGNPGDTAAIYSVCTVAEAGGAAGDIIFLTTHPDWLAREPREVVRITAEGELSASTYLGPIDGGTF